MKSNIARSATTYSITSFFSIVFSAGLFIVMTAGLLMLPNIPANITSCANSVSCIKNLNGKPQASAQGTYMGKPVTAPVIASTTSTTPAVLGAMTGDKHIFVDLTTQQLTAYQGGTLVFSFPVSSGKWNKTPTGDFHIWIKLRATRMTGGDKSNGTYYDLPNVPYTMYFYNDQTSKTEGYGIHGAYWHNNFGHPMSHGCINLSTENAHKLYDWVTPTTTGYTTFATAKDPGTLITITGVTPAQ